MLLRWFLGALAVVGLVCSGPARGQVGSAPRVGGQTSFAFTGVTVIDGTGAPPAPNRTVLVVGNRIQAVGPAGSVSIPSGTRVIEASGRFLIPGLLDMHVHMEMIGEDAFPLFLANGVTSVRDMGGDAARILAWRWAVSEGRMVGPRIRTAGPILESARWLQAVDRIQQQQGTPAEEMIAPKRIGIGSPAEAERAIDSLRKLGVDFVKIRTVANPATYFAILGAARRAGLAVAGHSPPVDLALAADSGQRSVEHSIFPALDSLTPEARSALFARWVANHTWSDPTLMSAKAYRYTADSLVLATLADSTNRLEPLRRYAFGSAAQWVATGRGDEAVRITHGLGGVPPQRPPRFPGDARCRGPLRGGNGHADRADVSGIRTP